MGSTKYRLYNEIRQRLLDFVKGVSGGTIRNLCEFCLIAPDAFILMCRVVLDPRIDKHLRIKTGIIITYISTPLDLLPEGVIGTSGYIEDFILALFALRKVIEEVDPGILAELWSGDNDSLDTMHDLADIAQHILGSGLVIRLEGWFSRKQESLGQERNGPTGIVETEGSRDENIEISEEDYEESQLDNFRKAGL